MEGYQSVGDLHGSEGREVWTGVGEVWTGAA